MFLVLGLLVTPSTLWNYALPGLVVAAGADLRRAAARGLALPCAVRLHGARRSSSSPGSACAAPSRSFSPRSRRSPACRTSTVYFNIAFFVVLLSLLVQGSTLTSSARRLGLALRRTRPEHQPGRDRHSRPDRAGDRRLSGHRRTRVILGLSRLPPFARLLMVVRKGHIVDAADGRAPAARRLRLFPACRASGSRASTACSARAPTWRGGSACCSASCRSAAKPPSARWRASTTSTSATVDPARSVADWVAARLGGKPALDAAAWRSPAGGWWCGASRSGRDRERRPPARRAAAGRARRGAAAPPRGRGRRASAGCGAGCTPSVAAGARPPSDGPTVGPGSAR